MMQGVAWDITMKLRLSEKPEIMWYIKKHIRHGESPRQPGSQQWVFIGMIKAHKLNPNAKSRCEMNTWKSK